MFPALVQENTFLYVKNRIINVFYVQCSEKRVERKIHPNPGKAVQL